MNPLSLQPDIRDLEIMVYGAAPLLPQPVYERDQSPYMDAMWIRGDKDGEHSFRSGEVIEIRLDMLTGRIIRLPLDEAKGTSNRAACDI